VPYAHGGATDESNCRVLCRDCNIAERPLSKFSLGDKVRIHTNGNPKHAVPDNLGFSDADLKRPRTIVKIRYDYNQQCNYYTLGSNGKGKLLDGQPLEGFRLYEFRSFQLIPYVPRRYHFKRPYVRKAGEANVKIKAVKTDGMSNASSSGFSGHSHLSQEILSK